ncbi:LOW QUALITY PROTEIN: perforin-1 [Phascolarctos cinereus]|uniref:LOW QUALITY PROTEIN: perforin-1 n=1 Tax=Phascolarctos cinereus TaxID=38626 RepID=A0A6P5JIA4_PHACI|nr:LOW QUALITY PROTEIN: perforin-1 [Phascolarctos cinereus]
MARSSSSSLPGLLLFCLFILLQPPWATPAPCRTATRAECRRHKAFVPGWELAGEGVDVTTLRRTGYFPVDAHRFERADGTCTLCSNDMQEGELQRLPLAITDWHSQSAICKRDVAKTEASSVVQVAAEAAKTIQNDWKVGLEIQPKPNIKGQIAVAASHSEAAQFAAGKTHQDEYSFTIDSVQCSYYRFHLVADPPLNQEFLRAVKALPPKFSASTSADYHRFIANYGTHFLKSVELGGRATDITALRTCMLALDGLKANDVSTCLAVEAAVTVGNAIASSDVKKCEEEKKNHNIKGSFHTTYRERKVEVEGGKFNGGSSELLFSDQDGKEKFSEWMNTLPSKPGLLAYTLEPLHFLLKSKSPWREELRQAVSHYVNSRARWQNCSKPCPPGQKKNPRDPCHCVCQTSVFTSGDCCPRERGLAHVEVTSISAKNLWGDYFTATDAYIKAFFGNKELRTPVVWNNNNPTWNTKLDFGTVQLMTGGPLRMQVWEADQGWDDDLLGSCDRLPEAGGMVEHCYFSHGHLKFHYQVTCAPHLKGSNCLQYAPRGALGEPAGNRSGAVW